jgi:hypothetical protein
MNREEEAFRDDGEAPMARAAGVCVSDENGKRHKGALWFTDDTDVLIRQDGRAGLLTFAKETERTRWGVAEDGDKM